MVTSVVLRPTVHILNEFSREAAGPLFLNYLFFTFHVATPWDGQGKLLKSSRSIKLDDMPIKLPFLQNQKRFGEESLHTA